MFVGLTVTGGSENSTNLIRWGANFAPLVHAGEYWRLITANFLHIGIIHIAFNSYALYALGAQAEALYGPRRYIAIYLLTGISGAIFSYMFTQGLSAGASTSLFGLFGALVVFFYKQRKVLGAMGQQQLVSLAITLGANVLLSLTNPRIDNWGHVGGFLGGLILAWFLCPTYDRVNPFAQALRGRQTHPPTRAQQRRNHGHQLALQAALCGHGLCPRPGGPHRRRHAHAALKSVVSSQ